ncbi:hypothetical protein FJT64_008221 [Amphibalanus amphitrite]|nr:hypothetical protein FJT64_008221 [Amphibalanus amphitrite]
MAKLLDTLHSVLETQRELRETQRIQGAVLNSIHRILRGGRPGETPEDLPQGTQLPVESSDSLRLLEERLSTDDDFRKALIQYLGSKGGSTVDETVKRIMPEVVTTTFGKVCNISGAARHGKVGLGKTKLFRVIFHAVNLNPTVTCQEKDLEKAVGKWLTNCRDRDGQRSDRGRGRPPDQ